MEKTFHRISKAALKFLEPLEVQETYKIVIKEAIELVDGHDGGLYILGKNNRMRLAAGTSEAIEKIQPNQKGYTYKTFKEKKAFTVTISEFTKHHPKTKREGINFIIFIPIISKKNASGVVMIRSKKEEALSEGQLKILELYGSLASLAIRDATLLTEINDALETRDHFLSLASHELRTPLTSINGYIQLLHARFRKKKSVESNWINELYTENNRLTKLVTELMDVNTMRAGRMQFDFAECHINEIAKNVVDSFKLKNPERTVAFKNGVKNDVVIGDQEKLTQMYSAILGNAAKFSPKEKKITIELSAKGKYILSQIIDEGEGIPKKDLQKIFHGFYKGTHIHKQGMGIGLMMVHHILDAHHGEIKIKSKEKKGTTIQILLPRSRV